MFCSSAQSFLLEEYLPKIIRCVKLLSIEQIWWRPNENHNSIGNLLLHLEGNVRQWIIAGLGGAPDNRVRQPEFTNREQIPSDELLQQLSSTVQEACLIINSVTETQLLETRIIQGLEINVLHAIFHVVEHFSMHTGQIVYITKLLTASPLDFYIFNNDIPQKNW